MPAIFPLHSTAINRAHLWPASHTVRHYETAASGWLEAGEQAALGHVADLARDQPLLDIGVGGGQDRAADAGVEPRLCRDRLHVPADGGGEPGCGFPEVDFREMDARALDRSPPGASPWSPSATTASIPSAGERAPAGPARGAPGAARGRAISCFPRSIAMARSAVRPSYAGDCRRPGLAGSGRHVSRLRGHGDPRWSAELEPLAPPSHVGVRGGRTARSSTSTLMPMRAWWRASSRPAAQRTAELAEAGFTFSRPIYRSMPTAPGWTSSDKVCNLLRLPPLRRAARPGAATKGSRDQPSFSHRPADAASLSRASTHCAPAGVSSSFQNGALGLQPVDQEVTAVQRGVAASRRGGNQDDRVARQQPAIAMDDQRGQQAASAAAPRPRSPPASRSVMPG